MLEGLDHVLRIDPSNEEVKRLRNKLHAQLLAGRLATDALSPQARFVDVSQQMRGRIAQQIAPYNSSVEKNPQSPKTYFDRAKFLALQGEYLEIAMNDCTKAIELWNLNKEIPLEDIYELRAACQSYRDGLGDFEAAISDYSRAIEVAPDNARLYQNRGACYKKRGKTVEAKADFEKAITLIEAFPNKPDHTKERLDAIRQEL
jgi:tetratricopeptide (TPR) repeat protein